MKKKMRNLLKIMGISVIGLFMISCTSEKEVTSEDFAINSSKIESKDGSYSITLDFYEKSPTVNYVIYENDKEFKSGKKDEKGKENKEFIITDKPAGEYVYKVEVKDSNSGIVNKEVKVKVSNNKISDSNNGTDKVVEKIEDKEIITDEPINNVKWNKESVEYRIDDKVSYEGKIYKCIQSHVSQESWTPLDAASLWKLQD